ncbi:uridine permease-like protein Fui1 [Polychaeton citri CBS 116435]|uniref:Uridine permease-like protein Fui1 n=1 Tax=Polychaeton citri CBS 116435 TaxID=1314669 RepID=A0A9P4QFW8_9PEZI|nr:uridine permease-like protein Fui1 [Polychaeton citri CBS 116435]
MGSRFNKVVPSGQMLKQRCTSLRAWEVPKEESSIAPPYVRTNKDMDPTPPEDQTWTIWTWMGYWCADMLNLGTWQTASAIITVGLTWREAIPVMVVGTFCVAVPMVLNGAIGAHLHIPFSVIVRSGFGYRFAYFCIVSRAILAMFWLGIQSVGGSYCITVMIAAIWPSYNNIPNRIAKDQGITTQGFISYFLFWLIQLPLLLIPPTKLRWLFIVKIVATPIVALATMGWCIHKAGSSGDLWNQQPQVSGSEYTYLWLSAMSSVTGTWATLSCNIPDFSRYAKESRGQWVQLPFLPIIFTACGILGIVTTSASKVVYDEFLWNPLEIIAHWSHSSGGRAAAFFAATAWLIAQVGTNITANSISAANDLTVLFPRWVNIKRGVIIATIIGNWVIVPWKILSTAQTFLAFMGGYAVFLAPMAGIMCADYWIIKRRQFDVPALYDPRGRYKYYHGFNWQGFVTFLVSLSPNLPGLAYSINSGVSISAGARHLYSFGWLYGFVTSVFLYTVLHMIFPCKNSLVIQSVEDLERIDGISYTHDSDGDSESKHPEKIFEKQPMAQDAKVAQFLDPRK